MYDHVRLILISENRTDKLSGANRQTMKSQRCNCFYYAISALLSAPCYQQSSTSSNWHSTRQPIKTFVKNKEFHLFLSFVLETVHDTSCGSHVFLKSVLFRLRAPCEVSTSYDLSSSRLFTLACFHSLLPSWKGFILVPGRLLLVGLNRELLCCNTWLALSCLLVD